MAIPVFKIIPTAQQYDWGKVGSQSRVAQLAGATGAAHIQEDKPYAELWMGTHPTSPSKIDANATLSSHLQAFPHLVGSSVAAKFPDAGTKGNLPFLFKVLSIEKALSIQTHPDKATAEKLHKEMPNVYKDDNHKPELALALTPFQALCGFMPPVEIAANLKSTPELAALIPSTILEAFLTVATQQKPDAAAEKAALRDLFAALMTTKEEDFKPQLQALVKRYEAISSPSLLEEVVLRVHNQFPGDIGNFCIFLLNLVVLEPGQAIFLSAGEPHAYLSGDIIECMANSDNVIRAGLTPKLRDVPNLISGLTYQPAPWSKHRVTESPWPNPSSASKLYDPPIPEFSVVRVQTAGSEKIEHPKVDGPSLIVVTDGSGNVSWGSESLPIGLGSVFFVAADTEISFSGDLTAYRAFVEAPGLQSQL